MNAGREKSLKEPLLVEPAKCDGNPPAIHLDPSLDRPVGGGGDGGDGGEVEFDHVMSGGGRRSTIIRMDQICSV